MIITFNNLTNNAVSVGSLGVRLKPAQQGFALNTNKPLTDAQIAEVTSLMTRGRVTYSVARDPNQSSSLQYATARIASDDSPYKRVCRLATTANVPLSGLAAIDGVTPAAGDRILVKAQTAGAANGIYDASAGAWNRSPDLTLAAQLIPNVVVFVAEGTAAADTGWQLTTNNPMVLGTTALTFAKFSSP